VCVSSRGGATGEWSGHRDGPHREDAGRSMRERRPYRRAPGDSTSLSYDSVVTAPVATSRRSTVFFFGSTEIASQPSDLDAEDGANICSVATAGSTPRGSRLPRGRAARSSRRRRTDRAPPSGSRPSRPAGAGAPRTTHHRPLRHDDDLHGLLPFLAASFFGLRDRSISSILRWPTRSRADLGRAARELDGSRMRR